MHGFTWLKHRLIIGSKYNKIQRPAVNCDAAFRTNLWICSAVDVANINKIKRDRKSPLNANTMAIETGLTLQGS